MYLDSSEGHWWSGVCVNSQDWNSEQMLSGPTGTSQTACQGGHKVVMGCSGSRDTIQNVKIHLQHFKLFQKKSKLLVS